MYAAMRKANLVSQACARIGGQLRHPATAPLCALILGVAVIPVGWTAYDQAQQFTGDDPVEISDRALDDVLVARPPSARSRRRWPPAISTWRKASSTFRPSAPSRSIRRSPKR